ncbi:MAG: hypothetical protein COB12_06755 [Flavobacterium sp.]|nr:MAG: hypothetical protein COB12_06755 [Flavobacterium sp.]
MNSLHITLIIIFVFIIVITIILNRIKKDRITLIGDFIAKVMPTIPISKIFGKRTKETSKEDTD